MASVLSRVSCRKADFNNPDDGALVVKLLNVYAMDPMGGGEPLSSFVEENLVRELAARGDFAMAFIAYYESEPAGLAICFKGFSTFHCMPLINIHDLVVAPDHRRRGICSALLSHIEQVAINDGCCKITMEVLEGNQVAKKAYVQAGFGPYLLDPSAGQALFWQKSLH